MNLVDLTISKQLNGKAEVRELCKCEVEGFFQVFGHFSGLLLSTFI